MDYIDEFKKIKRIRDPYQTKWDRMYYLYRGYRDIDDTKYPYLTKHLPPIGFQIVETIKPRLASLKTQIKFYNVTQEEVKQLDEWDNLINWQLEAENFPDKKIDWIHNALLYGDGFLLVYWDKNKQRPSINVLDNYLIYIDPTVKDIKNARYIFRQSFKKKSQINSVPKEVLDNLELNDSEHPEDPRENRYNIETKRMGVIGDDKKTNVAESSEDNTQKEPTIEVLEVFDFTKENRIVYLNGQKAYEETTDIKAKNFIHLKAVKQPHTLYSISVLEPVETLIYMIADNRNQAFTNMALTNNPVIKKRKGADINNDDIVFKPAAIWEMTRADDVVVDRPPEISKQWLEQDTLLYKEIENTLALSEYMRGAPASSSEPIGKVELLLMQSNIRLSLLVRQFENAITDLVELMVELNKEYLTPDWQEIFFKDGKIEQIGFTQEMKEEPVIADISVDIKPEKNAQVRKQEAIELWKMFVENNQPQTPQEAEKLRKIKNVLIRLILEEFDKDAFAKLLEDNEPTEVQNIQQQETPQAQPPALQPPEQTTFAGELQALGRKLLA